MRARSWLVFACGVIQALDSAGRELPPHGVPDSTLSTSDAAAAHLASDSPDTDEPASTRSNELIDSRLLAAAGRAAPGKSIAAIVYLESRPAPAIANELRAERDGELAALRGELRELHASVQPPAPLPIAGEHQYVESLRAGKALLGANQRARVGELARELERLGGEIRGELFARIEAAVADDQADLALAVERLGGRVSASLPTTNAAVVVVPAGQVADLATIPGVARVTALPVATPELDLHDGSLGVDDGFWAEGLTGGPWDVGILDSGVQQNHPAFAALDFVSRTGISDPTGHGTGVAGIIASGDSQFRGFSYGVERFYVGSATSSKVMADAEWMAAEVADGPEAINLSYGYGYANDVDDSAFDRFWDSLVDTHRVLIVKSAGNGGPTLGTLTRPANAYNVLSVANVDDRDTMTRQDDRVWFTSSRGPTLAGRKKPDLAAPGERTRTTAADWATGSQFADFSGTSAAAPHVASAGLLVAQLQGDLDPLAVKAVLINTADTWSDGGTPANEGDDGPGRGSRWSPSYGWGYVDLWEAWLNGLDVSVATVSDDVATAPRRRFFVGRLFADEKVTAVWNRHIAWSGINQPEALSDLDLRLWDADDGSLQTASTSRIDNVEQVAATTESRFVATVEVRGALDPDVPYETFALAAEEGWQEAAPPRLVAASADRAVEPGSVFAWTLQVENPGDLPLFAASVELTLPDGFRLASGTALRDLGTIAAGGRADVTWQVEAPDENGAGGPFAWSAAGNAFGAGFATSGSATVAVDEAASGGETTALFSDGFESGTTGAWSTAN